ncbi:MAG TPA: nuclear transport factor 2 family protein, partial [Longimicrobiales bacterium]|nr:nuclear transport factor 2 family protein [Longimicrobiales bacterium]
CTPEAPPAAEATVQPDPQEAVVLGVVQEFLDALQAHDAQRLAGTLLAEGSVHAVEMRPGEAVGTARSRSGADDIASMEVPGPPLLERIRNPDVRVAGRLAMVWAPYDFWTDGAWSHCGTDAFTLLKLGERWTITSISYTVETEGCSPAPLDG